jgi:hypothetical protein
MADRILCLGEALVDLICERPIASVAEADAFVPHFGGVVANVAVVAARAGAPVALPETTTGGGGLASVCGRRASTCRCFSCCLSGGRRWPWSP